jgi:hypothetical protein
VPRATGGRRSARRAAPRECSGALRWRRCDRGRSATGAGACGARRTERRGAPSGGAGATGPCPARVDRARCAPVAAPPRCEPVLRSASNQPGFAAAHAGKTSWWSGGREASAGPSGAMIVACGWTPAISILQRSSRGFLLPMTPIGQGGRLVDCSPRRQLGYTGDTGDGAPLPAGRKQHVRAIH